MADERYSGCPIGAGGFHDWTQNPYGRERCRCCNAVRWCPSTDTGPSRAADPRVIRSEYREPQQSALWPDTETPGAAGSSGAPRAL